MFCYPSAVRRAIYTANAIESLNMTLRKISKNRPLFPSDEALFKLLYLALKNISQRWTMPIPNWGSTMNQFAIIFEGRVPLGGLENKAMDCSALSEPVVLVAFAIASGGVGGELHRGVNRWKRSWATRRLATPSIECSVPLILPAFCRSAEISNSFQRARSAVYAARLLVPFRTLSRWFSQTAV